MLPETHFNAVDTQAEARAVYERAVTEFGKHVTKVLAQ